MRRPHTRRRANRSSCGRCRRARFGWRAAAGFAALVIAAALAVYLSFATPWRAAPPAPQPLARFDAAIGAPGTVAMTVGSSVAFTPDGEKLVFLVLDAGGGTSLYVRRLDDLAAQQVPGTSGAGGAFFFLRTAGGSHISPKGSSRRRCSAAAARR